MARSSQEIYEEMNRVATQAYGGLALPSGQVRGLMLATAEQLANMEAAIERLREQTRKEESREAE